MRKKKRNSRDTSPVSKKMKRQYELLGGVTIVATSALVVSIFLLTSLDRILIQTNQYASVIASVLVDLANGDRAQDELGGLSVNPVLVAVAQAKADDMAAKSYFAHTSPEGRDPWYWFDTVGYKYEYAGENLAVDFTDSKDVNTAWMNSPLHRDNIMNPNYTEVGIATAAGMYQGRPTLFVVQMFGRPAKSAAAPVKVVEASVPEEPERIAVATTQPTDVPQVLGEQVAEEQPVAAAPSAQEPIGAIKNTPQPKLTKVVKQSSWWERIAVAPRSSSQWAYYILALCVLLALAIDTGFELKWHHQRKAARAAFLLILIGAVFAVGNLYVFSAPTVPATGVASVAASL